MCGGRHGAADRVVCVRVDGHDRPPRPKLKRTFAWKIEKSVSQSAVTLKAGETADVTYTVTVTPTGSVDSDWGVSGPDDDDEGPEDRDRIAVVQDHPGGHAVAGEILADYSCLPATFPVELGLERPRVRLQRGASRCRTAADVHAGGLH